MTTPRTEATHGVRPIRRALIAVADKAGAVELAQGLAKHGAAIVSTGKTAGVLQEAGVSVTPVSEVTGFPEMLDGRVKTLHPNVHGGILADRRKPDHLDQLRALGIEPIDLVAVNLYPFSETVASGAAPEEVVEQIDIGGPAMVRAAAKNFDSVAVLVRPDDYASVLTEIEASGGLSHETRRRLARRAFEHVSAYDAAIAAWFASPDAGEGTAFPTQEDTTSTGQPATAGDLPSTIDLLLERRSSLRYGENPHQRGALFAFQGQDGPLGGVEVLQGKEMSFNNWLDADAARSTVALLDATTPAVAIVKHNNPCGVAVGGSVAEAYRRAHAGDPVSAFGGIVAFNREVDADAVRAMADVFTEVVVAPGYTHEALELLGGRQNLRVLRAPLHVREGLDLRQVDGGLLVQDLDRVSEARTDMRVVTSRAPTDEQWDDLLFAWWVAARVKSNAIVLAADRATIGIGAGQMNRVIAVEIAARQAGDRARGSSMASDAFFPFRDSLDRAAEAGVAAVIQPGGSVRDDEVVAAAEEHGLAMVVTGRRHFRH